LFIEVIVANAVAKSRLHKSERSMALADFEEIVVFLLLQMRI
jgi:hypothetical protein